jgi:hypothetical protein
MCVCVRKRERERERDRLVVFSMLSDLQSTLLPITVIRGQEKLREETKLVETF